ncbi:MAG: TetR/AcrR family transcriptional regulator [Chloroflexota bacterium]|nr:TetR/AcrR family transcriptional regulator [Anaerolineales bacterium]
MAETSGGRIERRKEKTKQKIVTTALALFQQYGFDATTMEQIAEEADIAKGTLYNYFPAKEAIVGAYIQHSFRERNVARMQQLQNISDTRSRMIFIFTALMEGVQAQKEIFEKYLVYQMQNMVSFRQSNQATSGFYALAVETIELGQANGEIRDDLPLYVLEDLFEFVFIEVVKQFYMEAETFSVNDAIERGVDLFLQGTQRTTP